MSPPRSPLRGSGEQEATDLDAYLRAIDEEIRRHLRPDVDALAAFYEMMLYHLGLDAPAGASGKRLRPLICLLVHEGLAGDFRPALPAAAALELLHNFTLIHDDIEDQDKTRRHRPTVWAVWGVSQAINAGDGMYALSRDVVQRLRELGIPAERTLAVTALLDRTCVHVCEGQFLDLMFEGGVDVTPERYHDMVARKTGALLRASAEIPGILATGAPDVLQALRAFGDHFGATFQAHDDLQGIWGVAAETGKGEMNDIAKRKMTLPLVLAVERASARERAELAAAYAKATPLTEADVRRVREFVDGLAIRGEVERFIARERARSLDALAAVPLQARPAALLRRVVLEATGGEAIG